MLLLAMNSDCGSFEVFSGIAGVNCEVGARSSKTRSAACARALSVVDIDIRAMITIGFAIVFITFLSLRGKHRSQWRAEKLLAAARDIRLFPASRLHFYGLPQTRKSQRLANPRYVSAFTFFNFDASYASL
jgi:hypothetical protein